MVVVERVRVVGVHALPPHHHHATHLLTHPLSPLQASMLSCFLPPLHPCTTSLACTHPPRWVPLLAARWLMFRFMFAMGLEKLPWLNGCAEWRDLTYTHRYLESEQPKPTGNTTSPPSSPLDSTLPSPCC